MRRMSSHHSITRCYLDYAAATPVRAEVRDLMVQHLTETYGNPSAIHAEGVQAKTLLTTARKKVATSAKIRPEGVIFTGSGTESNNLAIIGVIEALCAAGRVYTDMEIVSTKIEHPSVLQTLSALEKKGVIIRYTPLTETGLIDHTQLHAQLSPKTVLCTCAYVNSEIGVVQPLRAIARILQSYNRAQGTHILFHTDAAQAPLWLTCQLEPLGVDLLSVDAGKCYGPKGVGMLLMRGKVPLVSVLHGGSQEAGLRPATENVPSIVGAAEAFALAQSEYATVREQVAQLRDETIARLETLPSVIINGDRVQRVANNINISLLGYDSEYAVISLDAAGVACSTRSACAGADGGGSTVVQAVYGDQARAHSTIRFSLGVDTTKAELAQLPHLLSAFMEQQAPYQNQSSTQQDEL